MYSSHKDIAKRFSFKTPELFMLFEMITQIPACCLVLLHCLLIWSSVLGNLPVDTFLHILNELGLKMQITITNTHAGNICTWSLLTLTHGGGGGVYQDVESGIRG